MTQTIEAMYEKGVLRPFQPLDGVVEHTKVKVTVEVEAKPRYPLVDCIDILPDIFLTRVLIFTKLWTILPSPKSVIARVVDFNQSS